MVSPVAAVAPLVVQPSGFIREAPDPSEALRNDSLDQTSSYAAYQDAALVVDDRQQRRSSEDGPGRGQGLEGFSRFDLDIASGVSVENLPAQRARRESGQTGFLALELSQTNGDRRQERTASLAFERASDTYRLSQKAAGLEPQVEQTGANVFAPAERRGFDLSV